MTLLFLAQAQTLPIEDDLLAYGVKLFVLILAAAALVLTIKEKVSPSPSHDEKYATKEEAQRLTAKLERTDEKIDQLRVDVARNYSDLQASDEARTVEIHRRLDNVTGTLLSISEKVGAANV